MAGERAESVPADADEAGEIARLRREVLQLRQENARLSGRTQVLKEGVLMRFREQVLSQSWKRRFFDLRVDGGSASLRCFECRGGRGGPEGRGAARMTVRLGASVEILREAAAGGAAWSRGGGGEPPFCFQLKLPAGSGPVQLLRLGALSQEEADAWVEAFEAACGGGAGAEAQGQQPLQRSGSTRDVPAGPPKLQKSADLSALKPVHTKARESLLTAEEDRGGIPDCNVIGIVNLSITVMVIIHIRLIVDNLRKHGVVLDTFRMVASVSSNAGHLRCVGCLLGLSNLAAAALFVEKLAGDGSLSESVVGLLQGSICVLSLAVPIAVIRDTQAAPAIGGTLLIAATVLFMKLVSFVHVNAALRAQRRLQQREQQNAEQKGGTQEITPGSDASAYPANLTAKGMALFVAFPTLVYQTSYPRTERIRKRWLAKRVGELLVCLTLMSIITEQFVVPTLKRSAVPVLSFDVLQIVTAIMKLSVPNVYLWLFMFLALFHLWLNILAELTYFGDRLFYKEWWNATKLEDYWRLWNLPVHNWLVKHVFMPVLNSGFGKPVAVFSTFFVSAVFHELLVSVPCHTLRLWAFLGMMAQLPLVSLTAALDRRLKGSQLGNIIFWISFCVVGQPLCVLLYFAEV